jgi:phosphatidylserine/phosphatidylglycerophosphate/cardiolipin synthase-like enzyme
MRAHASNDRISVTIVTGTEAVLIGIDIAAEHREGLLGFSIWKKPSAGGEFVPLSGGRRFHDVPPPAHGDPPLSDAPVQDFLWGDYVVDPGTDYVYRVAAAYGLPGDLDHRDPLEIGIRTEHPDEGRHGIYFNRGVAASQGYSRKFGKYDRHYRVEEYGRQVWRTFVRPELVPDVQAFTWLSRGLREAMEGFIRRATHRDADGATPRYSLRAAVYEFTYAPIIRAFVDVLESGADVKIVHHAPMDARQVLRKNNDASTLVSFPGEPGLDPIEYHHREVVEESNLDGIAAAAVSAVAAVGVEHEESKRAFEEMLIPRQHTNIQHNKFIVLLDEGRPIEVWTGSTNLTAGGIFGQSNVGHVVRDAEIASQYLDYWQRLAGDPPREAPSGQPEEAGFAEWNAMQSPVPTGPVAPNSTQLIFSPRPNEHALDWYAEQMGAAQQSVHFTTAFTVAPQILSKALVTPPDGLLRYLLMESVGGRLRAPYEQMRVIPANRIAWGDALGAVSAPAHGGDPSMALAEALTGLNDHVNYLHTKYLLVDPLGADPLVINGSANFSKPSNLTNDENMIICRGDRRLADIFLSEFMRLFRHFEGRNRLNVLTPEQRRDAEFLAEDESWSQAAFTPGTPEHSERLLFANAEIG